ncbi:MAG: MBL fold metallo-hydrolase [Methanocellales archaeon]
MPQFEVHKVSATFFDANAYLVLAEKPVLIDVGMNALPVIRSLNKFKVKNLERIILTHCHHDHTGAANEVVAATGAKIYIHEADADLLGNDSYVGAHIFGEVCPTIKADFRLKEGDKIDLGGIYLEVLHTPGHTPGSICLYERKTKSLFSGDTVFPQGNIGRTDLRGGDLDKLVKSIKRLTELEVEVLYPGHMEVTSCNVNAQIKSSLRFAQMFW